MGKSEHAAGTENDRYNRGNRNFLKQQAGL
jgi:hypothetical protein